MGREENVSVFQDTERLCRTNEKIKQAVENSIRLQKLILEKEAWNAPNLHRFDEPAKVVVSRKRTLEAASAYGEMKVVVHNFASATNPGGGVVKGSSAQEECLCRCSGLYFCLNTNEMWKQFYYPHRNSRDTLHNDDIIFTPAVPVFKSDTAVPLLLSEKYWYQVDVITCAAPNLRPNPSNIWNPGDGDAVTIKDDDLLLLHEKRLRRILDVAVSEGVEAIILGAFGCGAFRNNPEVVARANRNVIKNYLHAFKIIEYAVYCSPRDDSNYRIFKNILGEVH